MNSLKQLMCTPEINYHAFHGPTKHQLETLWKFKVSPYWKRISPNYWCWVVWITFSAQSLPDWQWLEIGKSFKGHVEAFQQFPSLKRSVHSIEHFECFSIDILTDTLGWGWTCCYPSKKNVNVKGCSKLMQIKKPRENNFYDTSVTHHTKLFMKLKLQFCFDIVSMMPSYLKQFRWII